MNWGVALSPSRSPLGQRWKPITNSHLSGNQWFRNKNTNNIEARDGETIVLVECQRTLASVQVEVNNLWSQNKKKDL